MYPQALPLRYLVCMHAYMQVRARVIYVVYELNKDWGWAKGRDERGLVRSEKEKKKRKGKTKFNIYKFS